MIKELLKDNGLIIALITMLPSILRYISKKSKEYFEHIREEKIVKSSENMGILFDRMHLILFELVYSFIIFIIFCIIIFFAANYIDELNKLDVKIVYLVTVVIYTILSELFGKKIKENYRQLLLNLSDNKNKIRLNKLILLSPRIALNGLLIFVGWFEIKSNVISMSVATIIITAIFILLIKYFSATITYNRYTEVKLYFNNSYPVESYNYNDVSIVDSFLIAKIVKDQIKYNNNIIARVEYIGDTDIEDKFSEHLLKRGFIK